MRAERRLPKRLAREHVADRRRHEQDAQVEREAGEDRRDDPRARHELLGRDDLRAAGVDDHGHDADLKRREARLRREKPEGEAVDGDAERERHDIARAGEEAVGGRVFRHGQFRSRGGEGLRAAGSAGQDELSDGSVAVQLRSGRATRRTKRTPGSGRAWCLRGPNRDHQVGGVSIVFLIPPAT